MQHIALPETTITDTPGLERRFLEVLDETIRADIDRGDYHGANVIVARHGEIAMRGSYGMAEVATDRPTRSDDVYRILSMSKGFTNVLIYRALSEGKLMLSTRVVDLIPEFFGTEPFRAARKDRINLAHLLTHRAGMPATPNPGVGPEGFAVLADVISALCGVDVINEPGTNLNYSAAINHALMGEMARRAYGAASFRELMQEKVFGPIGMENTRFGMPADWQERAVPLKVIEANDSWLKPEDIECLNDVIDRPDAEMPWVGAVSTIEDVFAFTEVLRNRGRTANGEQLFGESVLDFATSNQTGDQINDLYGMVAAARSWDLPPGNMGLGMALAGSGTHARFFGPFVSPRTFGSYGAGSSLLWVDPVSGLSFCFLSSGVMDEGDNVARFQKLSTIAASAVTSK
ncbi:serine hydrolase domain-containing protein [Paeniglutamicibacter sulfureus]|uniref:CubicO group peptidase (Beta-lactamase class C family) n=1 Tax=Paeniglutamicibacter sulfureus TaxID=43666 RepID=A0ABU2BJH5_9MICC|nr:serine hydrolase domain-containing protein [Paeniglutamicibacter sulfureus]MDR7358801.1 CubicO group peptidase (beta-lactamase class C family) [Paeniglutamicibacter sulfureus]